jgi:5'-nucleotidase
MSTNVTANRRILTIAVSSRSLFHIEDGNEIFEKEGQAAFNEYMRSKENVPLRPGPAFALVRKLLALNTVRGPLPRDRVEVVLLSRNSPDAGMRVMNSIAHYGLDIEAAVFSQGEDRFSYASALGAHLFLSASPVDVRNAIEHGIAAATMLPVECSEEATDAEVRIAFDGDSVLFSDEADACYLANGLEAFRQHEVERANVPLGAGPFKAFLEALHELQKQFPEEDSPIKVGLVTARGMPSHARVINTLRSWGIHLDQAIFCSGRPKGPLLKTFRADIFFDDTQKNIDSARSCDIPSGHVPYGHGGIVAAASAASAEAPALAIVTSGEGPASAEEPAVAAMAA